MGCQLMALFLSSVPAIHCKSSPQSNYTRLQLWAFHSCLASLQLLIFIEQIKTAPVVLYLAIEKGIF